MDNKEKVKFCLDWIEKIGKGRKELNDHYEESIRYYKAEELKLGEEKGLSKTVTTTLSDAINWAMPIMMEIFATNEEVAYIKPRGGEDEKKAENLSALINYQTRVKNPWFLFCHDWIQDAFMAKIGWAKYQWLEETKTIDKKFKGLTIDELNAKTEATNVQIKEQTKRIIQQGTIDEMGIQTIPPVMEYDVTLRYTFEDEYPLIEAIASQNVGFCTDMKSIADSPFMYHRIKMDKWAFKRKYGKKLFDKIEQLKKGYEDTNNAASLEAELLKDVGGKSFFYDDKEKEYVVYENFYLEPDTGEQWITKICADEIIEDAKNEYDRPPFEAIGTFRQAHRLVGWDFLDMLKKFQELSTALLRNLLNNIYMNNQGRYLVDGSGRVNLDDFKNNNVPGGYIRVKGGDLSNAVQPLIPPMLQPWAFELYERVERIIEYRSGIPRSYKGVDVDTLNKTFRGQSQQIFQASQIIKMMSKLIAEMGFAPLIQDLIDCNAKFLKKKTVVRVLNEDVEIDPSDIILKADVIVNVGIGVNNKDMVVAQMQQLLGIYKIIYEAGMPVVTSQNIYEALTELVKAMGFKDTTRFTTDPKFVEAVQTLVMNLMAYAPQLQAMGIQVPPEIQSSMQNLIANMGMMGRNQKPAGEPKNIERPSAPINPGNSANSRHPTLTGDGNGFFG